MLPVMAVSEGGWALSPCPDRSLLLTTRARDSWNTAIFGGVGREDPKVQGRSLNRGQIDSPAARRHCFYHQSKQAKEVKIMINRYHWTLIPVRFGSLIHVLEKCQMILFLPSATPPKTGEATHFVP